jgi:ankyrin repeat protein
VKNALGSLPATLDETYRRILTEIAKNEFVKMQAQSILQWLAFSERPLTLQEVAEAAILKPGDDPIDPDERLFDPSDVLRICHGLVSLSIEEVVICGKETRCDVVRFAHFSVKEYLMSDRVNDGSASAFFISAELAHTHIGESCISYLLQIDQPDLLMQDLDDNPLLQYSAEYWFKHDKVVESGVVSVRTARSRSNKLLSQDSVRLNWLRICDPDPRAKRQQLEKAISGFAPPLYYASMLGLQESTNWLLEKGADVNAQVEWYGTALQAASAEGHVQIVQRLLNKGANINAQGGRYGTSLQAASAEGHVQIVQQLLDKGADVNAQGGRYGTALYALHAASAEGHDQIVQRLLDKGASVNAQGGREYGTALHAASARGHDRVVRQLLENGADVNGHGGREYGTALQAASDRGHVQIVQQLRDKGADVNVQGGGYGTTLLAEQAASVRGHDQVAQRLKSAVQSQ